jgi:hypothetical protein
MIREPQLAPRMRSASLASTTTVHMYARFIVCTVRQYNTREHESSTARALQRAGTVAAAPITLELHMRIRTILLVLVVRIDVLSTLLINFSAEYHHLSDVSACVGLCPVSNLASYRVCSSALSLGCSSLPCAMLSRSLCTPLITNTLSSPALRIHNVAASHASDDALPLHTCATTAYFQQTETSYTELEQTACYTAPTQASSQHAASAIICTLRTLQTVELDSSATDDMHDERQVLHSPRSSKYVMVEAVANATDSGSIVHTRCCQLLHADVVHQCMRLTNIVHYASQLSASSIVLTYQAWHRIFSHSRSQSVCVLKYMKMIRNSTQHVM